MFSKLKQGDNVYFFRMFGFMKPYRVPFVFGQIMYSAQQFGFTLILSLFVGNITAGIVAMDGGMVMDAAWMFIFSLAGFLLALGIGIFIHILTTEFAVRDMKRKLFRTFVRHGLEDSTSGHSGDSLAVLNTDATNAEQVFGWPLQNIIARVIGIVGSAITIFVLDWRLGLASVVMGGICFALQHRFTKPLARINTERLEANADSVKEATNILSGAMTIRAYNMQPQGLLAFDRENRRIRLLDFRRAIISTWQSVLSGFEMWVSMAIVFALGGWLAATGRMEFHLIMVALGMFSTFVSSLGGIGGTYANLQGPIAGAKRVFAVMDAADNAPTIRKNIGPEPSGYELNIRNLNFKYKDAAAPVLENIILDAPENKMIALVGTSGSGKSTLLRAIIGFYDRENMGISLGGRSIDNTATANWRKNFAYVDQSCRLFDMNIRENIAMGRGGQINQADIDNATARAACDFIHDLEAGYDTPCGEGGDALSGGQKQRIAIARALYKGAPILVFDEATSALDSDSERQIMETIENLRHDHTILITTHNLENIKTADIIIVMEAGKITESGTHADLIAKGGIYHRLYTKT